VPGEPNIANNCAGELAAIPGGSTVRLAGGSLAPGATCTVSLVVTSDMACDLINIADPVSAEETGPGSASNPAGLAIVNPAPTITGLSPKTIRAGSAAFTLVVTGTNFVDGAIVRWNSADRPTAYISSTQLIVNISATDIATPGTAVITVVNPAPGGGTSGAEAFVIQQPNSSPEDRKLFLPLIANAPQ
jgi:hypothetical protein